MEDDFEGDFDAGLDSDEEDDPKKYIQQLTGKLSQSLRSYNEDLPEPDKDLNKYVSGMVLKQSTDGLDEKDKNEILKKLDELIGDDGDSEDDLTLDDIGGEDDDNDDNEFDDENDDNNNEEVSESTMRRNFLNELFQDLKKTDNDIADKKRRQGGYRIKPY